METSPGQDFLETVRLAEVPAGDWAAVISEYPPPRRRAKRIESRGHAGSVLLRARPRSVPRGDRGGRRPLPRVSRVARGGQKILMPLRSHRQAMGNSWAGPWRRTGHSAEPAIPSEIATQSGYLVERTTGFEPATPTLASW